MSGNDIFFQVIGGSSVILFMHKSLIVIQRSAISAYARTDSD